MIVIDSDEEDIEPSRMTLKQLKEELVDRGVNIQNKDGRRVDRYLF